MSSPVSSCGLSIQNGEYQQVLPSQESPVPSTTTTVNEVTERIFADPSIPPSDGSCPILALTEGANQPHLRRIMFFLSRNEQIRFPLILNPVLEKKLKPLLSSFGVIYPYTEENENQTLDRITTILNSLKWNRILTKDEEKRFSSFSAKEIVQDPQELYLLLKRADRHNLVAMISKNVLSLDFTGKPFCQKVTAVLDYLEKEGEMITKLICSNRSLTNIPEEISSLGSLQELDLSYNKRIALPEWLGGMVQLQTLNLGSNNLTALPAGIGGLVQLQTLNLGHNNLTALPEGIGGLVQLQELDLQSNAFTTLPEGIGGLVQLQTLNLGHNKLTTLPEGIGGLVQLRWLFLRGNNLTALPEWLSQLPRLLEIVLSRKAVVQIPESLKGKVCFEKTPFLRKSSFFTVAQN